VASDLSTAIAVSILRVLAICILFGLLVLPARLVVAQDCSCGHPCEVILDYHNISGVEDHKACLTLEGGPDLRIEAFADVTLTAGEKIVLKNGFSVLSSATLILRIDPLLFCDVTVDGDEDFFDACLDCDDEESTVNPGGTEVCDGLDNDCDGTADEGDPGGGAACDTGLFGVCIDGTETCTSGSLQCIQDVSPSSEVCDGLDNDCDGTADEGNPGGGTACDTGQLGVCAAGTNTCSGGSLQCVRNVSPSAEVCDGLDNDCDGSIDEGNWGDSSNGGMDFPDSWFGTELTPGYPTSASGTVYGRIMPQGDIDWFSIEAQENLSDFCLTDDQDEPIKAVIRITPPGSGLGYKACACWSSGSTFCAKSSRFCSTGQGSTSDPINVEMDMNCGSEDIGYLDISVEPDTPAVDYSCTEYTLTWSISE
jgi:hypothetical protein